MSDSPVQDRRHRSELHAIRRRGIGDAAGAGRFLGAVVRPVPHADADARAHRRRLRRPLHAREGQHRRGAARSPGTSASAASRRSCCFTAARSWNSSSACSPSRRSARCSTSTSSRPRRRRNRRTRRRRGQPQIDQRDAGAAPGDDRPARGGPAGAPGAAARCARAWPSWRPPSAEPDVPALRARLERDPADAAARHALAAHHALAGDYGTALAEWLELMRRDRRFGDEAARRSLLLAFTVLGEGDELVLGLPAQDGQPAALILLPGLARLSISRASTAGGRRWVFR